MLDIEFFHLPNDKIAIQYNPEKPESIPALRDSLKRLVVHNPAYTFAQKYKKNGYAGYTEEYVAKDAEISNLLADIWKNTNDERGRSERSQNVMVLLERLTYKYIEQQEEIAKLREELQYYEDNF